ncbi:MAG: hypothetical protein MOB07_27630 [Acidobacteria bacterium]|nr:hypothetical protein [Acidobacteriota bacterium]
MAKKDFCHFLPSLPFLLPLYFSQSAFPKVTGNDQSLTIQMLFANALEGSHYGSGGWSYQCAYRKLCRIRRLAVKLRLAVSRLTQTTSTCEVDQSFFTGETTDERHASELLKEL